MLDNKKLFERRKRRTRHRLRKTERIKPRLSVFRSSKHIYAQIIDDIAGKTVAAAASIDKEWREGLKTGPDRDRPPHDGEVVAAPAKKAGVERGGLFAP